MIDFKHQAARRHVPAHLAALLAALVAASLLSACGGGGGNPGTVGGSASGSSGGTGSTGGTGTGTGGGTVTATPAVSLAFVNSNGTTTNSLTSAAPLTVKATVLDASKKPVPNAVVSFATDNSLAVFSPTAGTALTDVNGVASVTMRAASLDAGGAGTVTATSNVAGATVTGTSNYAVGATTLSFGTVSAAPSSIQAYGTTTLSAQLLSGSSAYTDQPVNVTFSSACATAGKAILTSTAATNTSTGVAQTVYRDQGCGQNDTITVSAAGVSKSATASLTIAPPAAASVQFVTAVPSDQSIVIKGQGGNGRTETATLTFKVVDISGNPLPGKKVHFTASTNAVTVNTPDGITDATGSVITTVNSGTTATSFRVQAALSSANGDPDISTYSDSIVVTTGLPVQASMSISSGSFNIEGWSIDSTPTTPATTIQVMLADAFGNPVPDGTPIVFQTNMGSVGSSSRGGCNTVNGGCSVDFRAQNPRLPVPNTPSTACNTGTATGVTPDSTRVGLATICASTSDGTNTVFDKTAIFFSGSQAVKTTMNGNPVSFDATAPNDLGTIKSSDTKVFQLQLNDLNNNPMPAGTKVELTSVLNANAAAVMPATVPNVAPHTASKDDPAGVSVADNTVAQGSIHTFSISSTAPSNCAGPAQASFNVTVTTPGGTATVIPFKLSFSCP